MERGVFISFEGGEGCGKSTQISLLLERLSGEGITCQKTREPGGTPLGEQIRHLLKYAPEGRDMVDRTELLLFAASRAQLVASSIRPALAAGTWIIADRFLDSSVVYQGIARNLGLEEVRQINLFAVGETVPDLTFLLDLDVETGFARASADSSRRTDDRMEAEAREFYEQVRAGYLLLADANPDRIVKVDANRSVEEVADEIWQTLERRIHGFSG